MLPYFQKKKNNEIQGQSILGKLKTHIWYVTDKIHNSPEEMYEIFFNFFTVYSNNPKYEITFASRFQEEMKILEEHTRKEWSLDNCCQYYKSIRTNRVESTFSRRLDITPKHKNYPKTYETRCHLIDLHWDEQHISQAYKDYHNEEIIQKRKRWFQTVNEKVFNKFPVGSYIEKRGRKKKN